MLSDASHGRRNGAPPWQRQTSPAIGGLGGQPRFGLNGGKPELSLTKTQSGLAGQGQQGWLLVEVAVRCTGQAPKIGQGEPTFGKFASRFTFQLTHQLGHRRNGAHGGLDGAAIKE